MKEQLVTFEIAKLAKEKGYNDRANSPYMYTKEGLLRQQCGIQNYPEEIFPFYICAPTQSLLQKWLREEQNISIAVEFKLDDHPKLNYFSLIYDAKNYRIIHVKKLHDTYEKALEESLFKALTLI